MTLINFIFSQILCRFGQLCLINFLNFLIDFFFVSTNQLLLWLHDDRLTNFLWSAYPKLFPSFWLFFWFLYLFFWDFFLNFWDFWVFYGFVFFLRGFFYFWGGRLLCFFYRDWLFGFFYGSRFYRFLLGFLWSFPSSICHLCWRERWRGRRWTERAPPAPTSFMLRNVCHNSCNMSTATSISSQSTLITLDSEAHP